MSNHTLFTQYTEAAEFLKAHEATVLIAVKIPGGMDTIYELSDGSMLQEHDSDGEPYTLDILKRADV